MTFQSCIVLALVVLIALVMARDWEQSRACGRRDPDEMQAARRDSGREPRRGQAKDTPPLVAGIAAQLRAKIDGLCGGAAAGELGRMSEWVSDLAAEIRGRVGLYANSPEEAAAETEGALRRKAELVASDVAHTRRYKRLLTEGAEIPIAPHPDTDAGAYRGERDTGDRGVLNHGRPGVKARLDALWTSDG
jgi:hypothetical protein